MSDYNTLLAAIHALDPFSKEFSVHTDMYGDDDCHHCGLWLASDGIHKEDCPVTHLRNILKEAFPAPFEHANGEHDAMVTIEAQNKKNETILKDIFRECRSRAEMGECPEPKYIKSPTDNGV